MGSHVEAPQRLELNVEKWPKLDKLQAGHLRHYHNLASMIDGEWHRMGGLEGGQAIDAYRYQIAIMAYAVGLTHYHRTPALRGYYKPLVRRLIHKMLRREVWDYWYNTSCSGNVSDPGLKELRKPWADPVARENIMYSGHLIMMTSLYAMLFDDDEFEKPESIVFHWNPITWGFGAETFKYDTRKIQDIIIREMEENGWLGVCCEPNMVFVVCNQFPLIAIKYNDARDGSNKIGEVLPKYKAAWDKKNMLADNGLFNDWWWVKQDKTMSIQDIGLNAWTCAFMNTWNSDFVKPLFEQQSLGFITDVDDKIRVQPSEVAKWFRQIVKEEKADRSDVKTLDKARQYSKEKPLPTGMSPPGPAIGYIMLWLSEFGKERELSGLLKFADEDLNPSWDHGGLFYPRRDDKFDPQTGELVLVDPLTGNSCIGYGRLDVPDGQKKIFEKPWTREELAQRPYIDGVNFSHNVDFLRGIYDNEQGALITTLRTWGDNEVTVEPVAKNLRGGTWAVYVNGELAKAETVADGGEIAHSLSVGPAEVNLIFKKID
ncbi:hypothetical protein BJX64DRAFT_275585 [Aspergillus heterothallicus]